MKKKLLILIISLVLLFVGGAANKYILSNESNIDTIHVKPCTVTVKKNKIKLMRDTTTIYKTNYNITGSYKLKMSHDFAPTDSFQGAKVNILTTIALYDSNNVIQPMILPDLTTMTLQPYPKIEKNIIINKEYSTWKKVGWFIGGSIATYAAIQAYNKYK